MPFEARTLSFLPEDIFEWVDPALTDTYETIIDRIS